MRFETMSTEQDITNIVLDFTVKYNIPFTDSMIMLERIIEALGWYDTEEDREEFEVWFKKVYERRINNEV